PDDLFDDLHTFFFGPPDFESEYADGWDPADWARRMGITFYSYPDDYEALLRPYPRVVVPDRPLHVDQLPPALREKCGGLRFWMLRFDEVESLQPFEHELDDLSLWQVYDVEVHSAYLGADGVTVRAVPGEEKRFADFVRQFREQKPEEATKLRFEEPTE